MHLAELQTLETETIKEISSKESIISFQAEIPLSIQLAMKEFIDSHPNWDQYRLVHAALAGFLMQHGVQSRSINRLYVGKMFGREPYRID